MFMIIVYNFSRITIATSTFDVRSIIEFKFENSKYTTYVHIYSNKVVKLVS